MQNTSTSIVGCATVRLNGIAEVRRSRLLLALLLGSAVMLNAAAAPTYSVTLAWDPNPEPTVTGYRAHYGVASRDYSTVVTVSKVTSVTLYGLVEGTTYYFAVTAFNALGLESDLSEELSHVPGTPSVRARVLPDGQNALTLRGKINHAYGIEATRNFNNWTTIATITMDAKGTFDFIDPEVDLFTRRFYRLRDLQP